MRLNKVNHEEVFSYMLNTNVTQQQAADHFGISRSGVSWILRKLASSHRKTGQRRQPWKGKRRDKKVGLIGRHTVHGFGLVGQYLFEAACADRGIKLKPVWSAEKYDYLVDRTRVEVKFSNGTPKGPSVWYNFTFSKNEFDVMACCLGGKRWMFFNSSFLKNYKGGIGICFRDGRVASSKMVNHDMGWKCLGWDDKLSPVYLPTLSTELSTIGDNRGKWD